MNVVKEQQVKSKKKKLSLFSVGVCDDGTRGKYFAKRGRLCLGYFRGDPGNNFWFLV